MSDQRSDSTNPSLLDRESKTIHDELGFRLVFYPSGLKGPREEEWTKRDDKPEDYPPGTTLEHSPATKSNPADTWVM
jgi:hypothetical protein